MAPMKTNESIKIYRPVTLCCGLLLVLSVMNTTKANAALNLDKDVSTNYSMTLFAVFDGMTKVSLQVPLEIEEVSTPPHHGTVWSWSAEMLDGFNFGTPTISFTHENDTSGFNTKALLHFDLSDWVHDESGASADGSFVLKLSNGTPAENRLYNISVMLRSVTEGFTIIEGQSKTPTFNEPGFSGPGKEGFTTVVEMFDWGVSTPPSNESLTINPEGRVIDYDFGSGTWNLNGTCRLCITDGSRPTSTVTSINVSLRSLVGDGYTIIHGQTSSQSGVSAAGANGFFISADTFDWSGSPPSTASLTLDAMAAVTDYSFVSANWTENGTFRIKLQDGNRPASYVTGRNISLRDLVGDGYTVINGQTSSQSGVSAAGANGFFVSADTFDWSGSPPSTASLTLDATAAVTDYSFGNANWTENGTFRIKLQDGSRPVSYVTGRNIGLRSIVPDTLTIPDNGSAGSINLEVGGDVGPWDWFDYQDGLANSDLTAPDTFGSSTLTISWDAGALESDEMGTGMVTVQRSDGSSPASTVALQTVVTPAPPVPVTCWPILAAMLAVFAVLLLLSQKYRTVS